MIQELADDIWETEAFHAATRRLQRAWIGKETGATGVELPDVQEVSKVIQASAILACSAKRAHRGRAYRAATSAYELFGATELPLHSAARVVLARLGNFPALLTRPEIKGALGDLPTALAAEEIAVADRQTVVLRDRPVVLTGFQHRLWTKLQSGKRVALTAPTSAGKSFVLQGFLASQFRTSGAKNVAYIVPTRALIAQVARDLRGILSEYDPSHASVEIVTIPLEPGTSLPSRAVYVMTQERLHLLLSGHPDMHSEVVIVDEAHSISDGARGVLLQTVIEELLSRRLDAQLLFATPGVRNLEVFGRLFGLEDIEEMPSNEPTVAQNFLSVRVDEPDTGRVTLHLLERGSSPLEVSCFHFERRTVTRVEKLVNAALAFGKGSTNLVYANGSGDAEAIALALADRMQSRETTERQDALSRLAKEAVHQSYALARCVQRGVGFHYSDMPTQLRQAVEEAVAHGDLDYLVCTSTLLQGVNLPAKNIFMCRPEKGNNVPLESVDFWNLAGRAGRLLREFQGNIFLVDYNGWKRKPLEQSPRATITPAIENGVLHHSRDLLRLITQPADRRRTDTDLEAVFVRLLDDLDRNRLHEVMGRFDSNEATDAHRITALTQALKRSALQISLPHSVIRRSPNISAHKQEELYKALKQEAMSSKASALALMPKHPFDAAAYESYAKMFGLCHTIILGIRPESRFNRFIALVALRWMQGYPLPRIVQNQIESEHNAGKDRQAVVRATLKLVEKEVRYQCVRLTACYTAILEHVLCEVGMAHEITRLPSLPLFLEIGASDRTMVSLMSLGLSRVAAVAVGPAAPGKGLDVDATARWLKSENIDRLELSTLLREEVAALIEQLSPPPTLH
jgi:hypothetical protein